MKLEVGASIQTSKLVSRPEIDCLVIKASIIGGEQHVHALPRRGYRGLGGYSKEDYLMAVGMVL